MAKLVANIIYYGWYIALFSTALAGVILFFACPDLFWIAAVCVGGEIIWKLTN